MNATEYKKYHESFMENNHGSSLFHTFACIFYTVQCSLKISIIDQNKSKLSQYVYEYILLVLPMILVHTMLSYYLAMFVIIDIIYLLYKLSTVSRNIRISKVFVTKNTFRTNRIHSISCMRGLTYLITAFCILAVDFQAFPRHLAKTEQFGYSLMDTGVGLFVLMSGLVHKDLSKQNYISVLKGNLKFTTILIILGVARFLSVKQLDYQEHITEYGVHWNFFFTLAICKLVSFLMLVVFNNPLMLSVIAIILHECLLHRGLQRWVMSDTPRVSFLDANREGIVSSLGYVSMYLFAANLKRNLNDSGILRHRLLMKLLYCSVLLSALSFIFNEVKPASRMLANTGYCLYVESILLIVLTIMYSFEVLSQDKEIGICYKVPLILSAINKNGLVYFLIANLTTGIINMSMQTLLISQIPTFIIINVYMIFSLTLIVYLNKYNLFI